MVTMAQSAANWRNKHTHGDIVCTIELVPTKVSEFICCAWKYFFSRRGPMAGFDYLFSPFFCVPP